MKTTVIGIIGCGNMGSVLIRTLRGNRRFSLCIYDEDPAKMRPFSGVRRAVDNQDLVARSDYVILAVKPQSLETVIAQAKNSWKRSTVVISIAAGVSLSSLRRLLPVSVRLFRVMPNLPALVGKGVSALCAQDGVSSHSMRVVKEIFSAVGITIVVPETWMDAVTAVSGSGPAYLFYFIEAFIEAAGKVGFPESVATSLVAATLEGALAMCIKKSLLIITKI